MHVQWIGKWNLPIADVYKFSYFVLFFYSKAQQEDSSRHQPKGPEKTDCTSRPRINNQNNGVIT
jgi:hypothetical protein